MPGTIEAIHIAEEAAGPVRPVPDAMLRKGAGIDGDRYGRRGGTFSDYPLDHELTLVEAEVIELLAAEHGIDLSGGLSRRNLTTRGVRLNSLVGKRFRVGGVLCEGTRLCEPCAHLESLTSLGGLARVMAGRGGLRALVLEDGPVRAGDPVSVEGE